MSSRLDTILQRLHSSWTTKSVSDRRKFTSYFRWRDQHRQLDVWSVDGGSRRVQRLLRQSQSIRFRDSWLAYSATSRATHRGSDRDDSSRTKWVTSRLRARREPRRGSRRHRITTSCFSWECRDETRLRSWSAHLWHSEST
jgi:hypothetical protein